MDYAKFSKENFEMCGIDTDAARMLADLLQDEVEREVHNALRPVIESIIQGLNCEGHNLSPYEIKLGELSYRDESYKGKTKLRLACDIVISSGYAHMSTERETPEEIIDDVVKRLRDAMTEKEGSLLKRRLNMC